MLKGELINKDVFGKSDKVIENVAHATIYNLGDKTFHIGRIPVAKGEHYNIPTGGLLITIQCSMIEFADESEVGNHAYIVGAKAIIEKENC